MRSAVRRCPLTPPQGLCPTCLIRFGLDSDPNLTTGPDSGPPLPACGSVIQALAANLPEVPHVQLREPEGGPATPVNLPGSPDMPAVVGQVGNLPPRLQLLGEIARGGMGAILKGRDVDLGRDIAVKVLLETHHGKTEMAQRFIEEAQIAGQLQHPGIAPVYELGVFPDRRPYFTMKLVKGKTLAALLASRKELADERSKFLGIFAQVCQTLAYAHARGVIHRDLKPSNVMVGAFGEVQVMDWGLAKVLKEGGSADEARSQRQTEVSVIRTRRSQGSSTPEVGSQTKVGSVLGTPAYMAPEQARGEVDLVDERADVFGLGAILCEILTGRAPFTGKAVEAQRKAQAALLDDAFARLDGCGADAELLALSKRCLAAEPWDRPRHAGELADAVTDYQQAVAERLRRAELERAQAEARADEEKHTRLIAEEKATAERRARRLAVGLAAAVLLTVLAGGGGWLWLVQDRASRERSANLAMGKAEQLMDQAEKVDPETVAAAQQAVVLWRQAEDLLDQAEGVLASGFVTAAARERLAERRQEVEAGLRRAEAVAELLPALDKARESLSKGRGSGFDYESAARAYQVAMAVYGLDIFSQEPEAVAARIRQERQAVRLALIVALDDWAFCVPDKAQRLRQIASLADDDPWQRRCRKVVTAGDVRELKQLAKEAREKNLTAVSLVLLAEALKANGARADAAALLRQARGRYPTDFWIHLKLGNCLSNAPHRYRTTVGEEVLGCYWAAVAVRPGSAPAHNNLGLALRDLERLDEAIREFHNAIEINPNLLSAHINLSNALMDKGRLDEAIAECQRAIDLSPKLAFAHTNLGIVLHAKGQLDEAIAEYHKAIDIDPKDTLAHYNLGNALTAKNRQEEAIAEYQKAVDLDPEYADAHNNLGIALLHKGRVDDAIAKYYKAIDLLSDRDPKLAAVYQNLGYGLRLKGGLDEEIAEHRKTISLHPTHAPAHFNLGSALYTKGLVDEAIAEYRLAIALDPKNSKAHNNLASALVDKGRHDEAIAEYRIAIHVDPKNSKAHYNLGNALKAKGRLDEAIA